MKRMLRTIGLLITLTSVSGVALAQNQYTSGNDVLRGTTSVNVEVRPIVFVLPGTKVSAPELDPKELRDHIEADLRAAHIPVVDGPATSKLVVDVSVNELPLLRSAKGVYGYYVNRIWLEQNVELLVYSKHFATLTVWDSGTVVGSGPLTGCVQGATMTVDTMLHQFEQAFLSANPVNARPGPALVDPKST